MEKYGNAAKAPDSEEQQLLLGQTEGYVEYNAAGRVIKGQEVKVQPNACSVCHLLAFNCTAFPVLELFYNATL